MFHLRKKLAPGAGFGDLQPALLDGDLATIGECADEDDPFRVLADVDEAPGAGEFGAEFADVDVALLIDLRHAEKRDIQPTTVVKVELRGLVDDRLRIASRAEIEPTRRNTTEYPRFGGEGHQVNDFLFVGDVGDAFRHADPQIDHAVRQDFEGRAPGDNFTLTGWHEGNGLGRYPNLAAKCRIVGILEGLPMVFGRRDHDAIHQYCGNLDVAGVQAAAFGQALDLNDDDPAGVVNGGRDGQYLQGQRFLFHGDITVRVRGRPTNQGNIDRESLIKEVFFAADGHQFDDILGGQSVHFAATEAGIDESPQTYLA